MKTFFFAIALLLSLVCSSTAQDKIYAMNGDVLEVKILEINDSEIKFLKYSDLKGSSYVASRANVHKVVFENGTAIEITPKKGNRDNNNSGTSIRNLADQQLAKKRSTFYLGLLGSGGLLSVNYEHKLSTKSKIHPYAKFGFGMTNKGMYLPHSLSIGIGSIANQFELGIGGIGILKFTRNDMFKVIFGEESAYVPHLIFGYRHVSPNGFFFNIAITPLLSKDIYTLSGKVEQPEWGITPWIGTGFGFNF